MSTQRLALMAAVCSGLGILCSLPRVIGCSETVRHQAEVLEIGTEREFVDSPAWRSPGPRMVEIKFTRFKLDDGREHRVNLHIDGLKVGDSIFLDITEPPKRGYRSWNRGGAMKFSPTHGIYQT
jgi:hypothetical protein